MTRRCWPFSGLGVDELPRIEIVNQTTNIKFLNRFSYHRRDMFFFLLSFANSQRQPRLNDWIRQEFRPSPSQSKAVDRKMVSWYPARVLHCHELFPDDGWQVNRTIATAFQGRDVFFSDFGPISLKLECVYICFGCHEAGLCHYLLDSGRQLDEGVLLGLFGVGVQVHLEPVKISKRRIVDRRIVRCDFSGLLSRSSKTRRIIRHSSEQKETECGKHEIIADN
ncbi:hypothetical protein DAPPUDRAFT_101600 [Daphnia pulex]|uniref:Uncharacterized protein n=1 Tax=Daphnia pulex TaxID=6669 RepID=E9GDX0_DAPPU|nr:hypothetical protein DAPPUDRAFT_101600 [Daphnia pulex]|eukprot:EFX82409.1 hypothetical protein DAPPUDRAFT_101600 [Daphnia pulex]